MDMTNPVRVALIGSGRMGSFHGRTLAQRLPGVHLAVIADPAPGAAGKLAAELAVDPAPAARAVTDPAEVFADPDVDAVVIAAPARFHTDLVVAAAAAGKDTFCEKPMALSLADADRALAAVRDAGTLLQIGFNRRFAADWHAARGLLDSGDLGTPRQIRSLTRDPGGFDPSRVAPGTIFNETLIHDFDTLRYLNPGARAVRVFATATATVEPDWRDRGLQDTATVLVEFDNGAVGIAEACFEAAYGYDVRGELFAAGGMATMGDGRSTGLVFSHTGGRSVSTARSDQELLDAAYVAELAAFTAAVRRRAAAPGAERNPAIADGTDARAALEIALAAAESVRTGRAVRLDGVTGAGA
ncbi:dehydrogenase [Nakamurella flava]|uniref:Dehydrogenase n=2 Tax=Nakamurella flava TaxID=2576308 RepID=A0A4U6QMD9_9ACTN|nr:dehydrogenase [Nakamurella flava]